MSEISILNGLSINPTKSHVLKNHYEKHVRTIVNIAQKKSNIKEITEQQQKISDFLRRSKQVSKSFKQRQFELRCDEQNKRLIKSISMINSRQRTKTCSSESKTTGKKKEQKVREDVMRQFQIQRGNTILAHNIIEKGGDIQKYKKKMQKQINQYMQMKSRLQKLKPIPSHRQKGLVHQDLRQGMHETIGLAKLKLKTLNPELKMSELSSSIQLLQAKAEQQKVSSRE